MNELTVKASPPPAETPEQARTPKSPTFRHRFEYFAALTVLKMLGGMPHRMARTACGLLAALSYWLWPRLRRVGMYNLRLAFPDSSESENRRVLHGLFRNLGRMLGDFAHFPRMNRGNIERYLAYEGFEHYERAQKQGKGILFLTAHFGNWEISSFGHGLYGHPLNFVVRDLDNPLIGALVERYRSRSGGRPIEKTKFGSQVLRAFKNAEAVGILMDQNMLPNEGSFVDFFGRPACTTTAPARLARRTGVPIVLGLVIWDQALKKHKLHFDPVDWITRDNAEEEILANTANFTRLLEDYIRRYPDHWLWVHRRWKTRPPGDPPLYQF